MKRFLSENTSLAVLGPVVLALALAHIPATAMADEDVYICVNADGVKEYKNTGDTKGCKKAALPQITVTNGQAIRNGAARPATSANTATPPNFPKIDGTTQRARDDDRKQLLQNELQKEQSKMDALQKDYNNGAPERQGNERNYAKYQERVAGMKDDLDRSQKNIDALKRELGQ